MEPQVLLLFIGLVLYTMLLIFVEWRFASDAVVFTVISNLVSGFAGAFFGRMKPADNINHQPGETTTSATVTKTEIKPEEPAK